MGEQKVKLHFISKFHFVNFNLINLPPTVSVRCFIINENTIISLNVYFYPRQKIKSSIVS